MKNKDSRLQMIAVIIAAVLIIGVALTVRELVRLHPSYVRETPAVETTGNLVTDEAGTTETPFMPSPGVTDAPIVTDTPAAGDDGILSLLLVCNDSQEGSEGLLDTLVAAGYEKTDGVLKLILLTRELYVQIPEHGWDTLGRAYQLGGIELLSETVRQNFGIELEGCLVAEYVGLEAVINALGGIEIDLSGEEAAVLGLEEGINRLSGRQALDYLAMEDSFDESGSAERRRSFILRLMSDVGSLSSSGILKLAYAALPYISTDMNRAEVFVHALGIYNGGVKSIEKYSIPAEDGYEGEDINGISVIRTDMEENRRLISTWIYGG